MTVASLLQQRFGGQWVAARIHLDEVPGGNVAEEEMRLCDAISRSFDRPLIVPVEKISCAGACRSLGTHNDDPRLADTISADAGIQPETMLMLVREASALASPAVAVSLGDVDPADVVLGFVQPAIGMLVIRRWQQVFEMAPTVEVSSFMAICGNVLVAAYEGSRLCLSLGCPHSRKFGFVRDDTLIVGMPYHLAEKMAEADAETHA